MPWLKQPHSWGIPSPLALASGCRIAVCRSCCPCAVASYYLRSLFQPRIRRWAQDETIVTKVAPSLLVSPIDDSFWAVIDDLKICRHRE
jgi:hypothetical protein